MGTLKSLKRDVYLFIAGLIYFSTICISIYITENTFNWLSFILALAMLCSLVLSLSDIKNKNYKIK
ncbi:hypothetical protein CN445_06095 [Bacillus cereus]|uniref:hypothetical protein n=1 Tax=Bacillus nitratireducens TaxID=2026193 RepID=UPI00027AAC20|nr:hypothetical protein [Bacillus nitratireducens]EJS54546.1 hypothetical protein ICG_02808 [Bacillus cereus BAG1X1-3]EOO77096.1 hypothetical protein IC7_02085 [Bacillus cereus BAG1O-1]PEB79286.1 hypothetical protein COM95_22385 [Bacillus cereus]MED0905707.1 hypothetical protein [Bacillus nitratireducens]OJD50026.1 hypothetical protein BAU23_12755 [Bacillus nitratireducens]